MKKFLWLLLAVPSAVMVAQMPSPVEKPTAYLEVKSESAGNKESHIFRGNLDMVADSTKENVRSMTLDITVGTTMHSPLTTQVEWYFVAKDIAKKRHFIYDHGTKDVVFPSAGFQDFETTSKPLKSTVTSETLYGMSQLTPKVSGGKPDGWVVRVIGGGQVLAMRASTTELEDIANDPEQFHHLQTGK